MVMGILSQEASLLVLPPFAVGGGANSRSKFLPFTGAPNPKSNLIQRMVQEFMKLIKITFRNEAGGILFKAGHLLGLI